MGRPMEKVKAIKANEKTNVYASISRNALSIWCAGKRLESINDPQAQKIIDMGKALAEMTKGEVLY